MAYADYDLEQMDEVFLEWDDRADTVLETFARRENLDDRTKEIVLHGLSRRITVLRHCKDRIFSIIPPQADCPSIKNLMDATAFLHAFYINCYGSIDNLARVWVFEKSVKSRNGRELSGSQIGFSKKCKCVRDSLTPELLSYVANAESWLLYIENYRHALAHRIPLYIPPCTLDEKEQSEFADLQFRIDAAIQSSEFDEIAAFRERQQRLGSFKPLIMHSFGERATPVLFHGQIINDFSTVIEWAEKIVEGI